ncbi:ABC transporter related protein [Xylanimonas cellulosilytica DSM 15894]|uniref:ABC transporter related protein n=1 Tax=Xylanimonas cellulosilytica (strain DSM 15894 / JCM 12276 / CECT 5975 / KCTC 9989 / LMG 20990 / NBRC 107835 / XIL07) TaxID=446471 RepID=D1BVX0_XYLCX|nr:ABC transporter related protein [Xylanimonas cellulosilytica DSM 15894]
MAQDLGGLRRSAAEVRAEERGTRHSGAQPQSDPEILGLKGNHQADGPTDPVVVRDLVRAYGDAPVLDHLDLRIAPGEFVAILGRSGSGKSTLLRALAGLDRDVPGTGEITVPRSVSVVFQDSRLLPWARVLDNVVLGLEASTGLSRAEARRAGAAALAEVGLAGRERAWPGELSGGEQQRVSLARSLVRSPELLLADEPFGALDALTRTRMHGLLRDLLARHRPAVLMVTHDVDEAIVLADRVVVLDVGRIAAERSPADHPDPRALRAELLAALGVENATPDPHARQEIPA